MINKPQKSSHKPMSARDAIDACGGTRIVTKALGITRQSMHQWIFVPPERCPEIEFMSGIPREEIRPDVFRKTWLTADVKAKRPRPTKPLRKRAAA